MNGSGKLRTLEMACTVEDMGLVCVPCAGLSIEAIVGGCIDYHTTILDFLWTGGGNGSTPET